MSAPGARYAEGRALRKRVPRGAHAAWEPRRRPAARILAAQDRDRLPDLVPVRRARMAESPLAFLRGAAAVMAADLAGTPDTGLRVQACGDAHLLNFGVYASPERTLLFDVDDFDETLPGPWEWDLKRLAASCAVAAADNGCGESERHATALAAATGYRDGMREFAALGDLALFFTCTRAEDLLARIPWRSDRRRTGRNLRKARGRDSMQALRKLTTVRDGRLRIADDPPLLEHTGAVGLKAARANLRAYRRTLREDVAVLLDGYTLVDAARKAVGVGSVGTRCYVAVLQGRDRDDPLVLQVKEAGRSVLEPHLRRSEYLDQGHRVVAGQRLMQSSSDPFLGWSPGGDGRFYYWRQYRDMKGSADVTAMPPRALRLYARACGRGLALAHARTGDRLRIAGYIGRGEVFCRAVAAFGLAYAERNAADHREFLADNRG
ncbi:DUF2252 domain-containing protein [Actinomadura parmotrematis]|uniref:DUF2252 domain-containing protein n=1 Tax=Actinomadura parmotrematis TaxID=2864039 RepID=A0ABS7FS95_9ACTN|nr:DUF2252 domain-containing protein [Actinomadura parmotrematis]MBW8482835.1 DUF2252 domain-containing protein [Actinomadura parmotrematis]